MQLESCGCKVIQSDGDATALYEYRIEDPRYFRRFLEHRFSVNRNQCEAFLDGLREHLVSLDVLKAALRPAVVTGEVCFRGMD